MKFFKAIFPYGGSFGDDTVFSTESGKNKVSKYYVHFVTDYWPEEVFSTAGCYAVSEQIRNHFEEVSVTGIRYQKCTVSLSWQYYELNPDGNRSLPDYFSIIIEGCPRVDDFGIEGQNTLIVSGKVKEILKAKVVEDLDLVDLE